MALRKTITAGVLVALLATLFAGLGSGHSAERDEITLTVPVSSSEHELVEGYFTLGDAATVVVKPGSDLYKFLARHRGRKVRVTVRDATTPELSRLQR